MGPPLSLHEVYSQLQVVLQGAFAADAAGAVAAAAKRQ